MGRHVFTDPTTGAECTLVIDETAAGEHGVEHPGCTTLADVVVQLDAWWCSDGDHHGRVDGAWATERWREDMRAADWAGA